MHVAKPSIGVVIPTCNSERFIKRALESVFSQTLPPSDIVVVDDGSHDGSASIAARMGARVVVLAENMGPASARNAGTRTLSQIEFFAFLDADDVWAADHLEILAGGFSDDRVGVVFSKTGRLETLATARAGGLVTQPPRDMLPDLLHTNPVSQSSVMVRATAFKSVGGYIDGLRYSEDYDLWIRLSARWHFVFIDAETSFYEQHPFQASRNTPRMIQGALDARRRGIAYARAHRTDVTEAVDDASQLAMAKELVSWASYHASIDSIRILRASFSAGSPAGQYIDHWWKAHRLLWPMYRARAFLRRIK